VIILINWWLNEEPQVDTFETRKLAEDHIKANLCSKSGEIEYYDVYEGKELGVKPNGSLSDIPEEVSGDKTRP